MKTRTLLVAEMKVATILAASAILAGLALPPAANGAGGILDQSIDALFNLRDQLQAVVMKSVPGVAEAMQEGPAPEAAGESTIAYLNRMQGKYQELYNINKNLLQAQKELQKVDLQLLVQLPKNDPRRQGIATEIKEVGSGMGETKKSVEDFGTRLGNFKQAIKDYNRKHGIDDPRDTARDSVDNATRTVNRPKLHGTAKCPDGH